MARPRATSCTVSSYVRDGKLYVRYSFPGMKVRIGTGFSADKDDLDIAGYLKRNRRHDADDINPVVQLMRERLQQAHDILVGTGKDLCEAAVRKEYDRLVREAEAASLAHLQAQEAQQLELAKRRKRTLKVTNLNRDFALEDIPQVQADLNALLAQAEAKRQELHNLQKTANVFEEDSLKHYLTQFMSRNGSRAISANYKRTFTSFINTVERFAPDAKIQDVDDAWLFRFQDWLLDTPAIIPIYKFKRVVGKAVVDKFIGHKTGKKRLNSTVESYVTKIKSCLNYYHSYPELLPHDVTLNLKYKRWEFNLAVKEDNVVSLEEWEVLRIKELLEKGKLGLKKKAHYQACMMLLFLCATGLRLCDAVTIKGTNIKHDVISKITKKTKKHSIEVHVPVNPISLFVLKACAFDLTKLAMDDSYFRDMVKEALDDKELLPSLQIREKLVNFSGQDEVHLVNGSESPEDQAAGIRRCDAIGSHSGRRTFINILLDHNIPMNKIMGMSGHLTLKNLMVYANKRKHVERYTKNIFKLPTYEPQDYSLPGNLLLPEQSTRTAE